MSTVEGANTEVISLDVEGPLVRALVVAAKVSASGSVEETEGNGMLSSTLVAA